MLINKKSKPALLIASMLALLAGIEGAIFTLVITNTDFKQVNLLAIAVLSRLAGFILNPLLIYTDQVIEKESNSWLFTRCQTWPLTSIREPAFQRELATSIEQIEKVRHLIITQIIPGITSITATISLVIVLSTDQTIHLYAIIILTLIEVIGRSISTKFSHTYNVETVEPRRRFQYLKHQLFSSSMLREHRVCHSLPAVINEITKALTAVHNMARRYFLKQRTVNLLIRFAQALCILLFIYPGYPLLRDPVSKYLNMASLGLLYGAYRLLRSGSQLGRLPSALLEIRLYIRTIKDFDKYSSTYHDNKQSLIQVDYLTSANSSKVTALIGPNGSGKSTLILALAEKLSTRSFKSPAGFLFQNFCLLQSSIQNNIVLYNDSPVHSDKMEYALHYSGFGKVMTKYGWELSTEVGEEIGEGRGISLGEWQKLALARALYYSNEYLILDEPDAHLDSRSRQSLEKQIQFISQNTKLVIASHSTQLTKHASHVIRF